MTKFVRIGIPIFADWVGFPPTYRVFVNGELFAERSYYAEPYEFYEEMLQIQAQPGAYNIRFEPLDLAEFTIAKPRVLFGPAVIESDRTFRIL